MSVSPVPNKAGIPLERLRNGGRVARVRRNGSCSRGGRNEHDVDAVRRVRPAHRSAVPRTPMCRSRRGGERQIPHRLMPFASRWPGLRCRRSDSRRSGPEGVPDAIGSTCGRPDVAACSTAPKRHLHRLFVGHLWQRERRETASDPRSAHRRHRSRSRSSRRGGADDGQSSDRS